MNYTGIVRYDILLILQVRVIHRTGLGEWSEGTSLGKAA